MGRRVGVGLAAGWQVLRFSTQQINEETETYCISEVVRTINTMTVCAKFTQSLDLRYTSQTRMSPTIFRQGPYRFFFNSREETRMHVHVMTPEGTAKFWLEPLVALADYYMLNEKELRRLEEIVRERQHDFISAWRAHFKE